MAPTRDEYTLLNRVLTYVKLTDIATPAMHRCGTLVSTRRWCSTNRSAYTLLAGVRWPDRDSLRRRHGISIKW